MRSVHLYAHERFVDLTREEQKAIILRSQDILSRLSAKKPSGLPHALRRLVTGNGGAAL